MLAGTTFSSAVALLAFASHADAHGHLNEPKPTFQDGKSTVNWVVQIYNIWDIGSGGDQVGKFKTLAKAKGKSVKDVVLEMVGTDKKCGFTRSDAAPQPVPTDGPCELYIDDKMVLHSDDCESDYPGGPNDSGEMSIMPVDYSSCNGEFNCVALSGSVGSTKQTQSNVGSSMGTKPTESSSTGKETTPSTKTESSSAQTPTTESSWAGTPSTPSTPAPATTTQAESPSADAPSTPSTGIDTKCTAPARRLRKKTN